MVGVGKYRLTDTKHGEFQTTYIRQVRLVHREDKGYISNLDFGGMEKWVKICQIGYKMANIGQNRCKSGIVLIVTC